MATTKTDETTEAAPQVLVTNEDAESHLRNAGIERLVRMLDTTQTVAPIDLAKALNVKPQMVYNYTRNGRGGLVAKTNSTDKMEIPAENAIAFAQAQLNRRATVRAQVEAELAGTAS
jgi:hypothetical protein